MVATGVRVDWENITATVKNRHYKKKLGRIIPVNNVSGYTPPGSLMAIMGSSGAGKTTLMNILAQRNLRGLEISGDITLNGVPVTSENIMKLSGYIQQDDVFVPALTVRVRV